MARVPAVGQAQVEAVLAGVLVRVALAESGGQGQALYRVAWGLAQD